MHMVFMEYICIYRTKFDYQFQESRPGISPYKAVTMRIVFKTNSEQSVGIETPVYIRLYNLYKTITQSINQALVRVQPLTMRWSVQLNRCFPCVHYVWFSVTRSGPNLEGKTIGIKY